MTRPSRRMFPQVVTVQRLDTTQTGRTGGNRQPVATTVAAGVACLIVDKRGGRGAAGDRDLEKKTIRVLFPDRIEVREQDQILYDDATGRRRIFRVDSFRDDLQLGRLWIADCAEQVEPL